MWPAAVDDDVERGIADDTAVPVSLAVDHCARETRWQAAAGPNVVRREVIDITVEHLQFRRDDIDSGDEQADVTPLEHRLQRVTFSHAR